MYTLEKIRRNPESSHCIAQKANRNKTVTAILSYLYQILLDFQDALRLPVWKLWWNFFVRNCLNFAPFKYCRNKLPVAQKTRWEMEIQKGIEGISPESQYAPFYFRVSSRQKLYRMSGKISYSEAGRIHCFEGEAYYRLLLKTIR